MKTLTKVLAENKDLSTVINAVYKSIGKDSITDVINNGIDGGFNGFIYYSDTHDFTIKHRKTILSMLEQLADNLGEDAVQIVSGFGVFRYNPIDAEDKKDLYTFLGGGKPKQGTITNVLAWFCAEEICILFED